MDCWDGPDGEPIIFHGGTMTSKIYVSDVCQVIKDYGFLTSEYPVILSVENHCSVPQQARMAEIFQDILGPLIECSPIDPTVDYPVKSPEELKHRILIKGSVECPELSKLIFMRSTKLPSSVSEKKLRKYIFKLSSVILLLI